MKKYQKKPGIIEAVKWDGNNFKEIESFVDNDYLRKAYREGFEGNEEHAQVVIPTLEGAMIANIGDYIIKGVEGEFYPCKPDIFHKTYEKVNEAE